MNILNIRDRVYLFIIIIIIIIIIITIIIIIIIIIIITIIMITRCSLSSEQNVTFLVRSSLENLDFMDLSQDGKKSRLLQSTNTLWNS